MNVRFENWNNNDTPHEIIFLSLTKFACGPDNITVLFDGHEYSTNVFCDSNGHRFFKHCGKVYDFEIVD